MDFKNCKGCSNTFPLDSWHAVNRKKFCSKTCTFKYFNRQNALNPLCLKCGEPNPALRAWCQSCRRKEEAKNPEKLRQTRRRAGLKRYGLTAETFNLLLTNQEGKCKICRKPPQIGQLLFVDHCHKSGAVRGLLCNRCNYKLGWYEKNKNMIIEYLDAAQHGNTVDAILKDFRKDGM